MRKLGPFPADEPRFPIAIAVSGGADSLGLAFLLRRWRRAVIAFVVDHGLREASASEAGQTAERLATLDIPARILTLSGLSKTRRLQENARQARYEVLSRACAEHGALDLALGHHARDQAETFYLRRAHGSTPHGLAAMALARETPSVRYIRPLLSTDPARLRATLTAHGLEWIEDPSNQNMAFERVRIRNALGSGLSLGEALVQVRSHGQARLAQSARRARDLSQLCIDPLGFVVMPALPDDPVLLGQLWQMVSGQGYAPAPAALKTLIAQPGPCTLAGGILFAAGRLRGQGEGGWCLAREAGAIRARCAAHSGTIWDGRFRIADAPRDGELEIACLGAESKRFRHHALPSRILAGLPGVWRGAQLIAVPPLNETIAQEHEPVTLQFSPRQTLTDRSLWV
ncbi:tRNA lysidine(34) synthetase TilS [Asaia lannensis]|uniref:tRNA lysidine(34) synthetase TilS n=1 Tax=Asaia lannensis TaxID=415421 RepID=UPI0021BD3828